MMGAPNMQDFYTMTSEFSEDGVVSTHEVIKMLNLLNLAWSIHSSAIGEHAYHAGVAEHMKIEENNPWAEEIQ